MTRGVKRRLVAVAGLVGLAWAPAAAHAGTRATREVYRVPASGVFTLQGHGNGHGHGMSQWGAYGAAAAAKLSAAKILAFYYPHTTRATEPAGTTVRVLLSAAHSASRGYLQVAPATRLKVSVAGKRTVLPTTTAAGPITGWRLAGRPTGLLLRQRVGASWHTVSAVGDAASFRDPSSVVPVVEPSSTAGFRGVVSAELRDGDVETVDRVPMESYLRSVVPAEMSPSWPVAALRAQAVASRTYAAHGIRSPKASWYDVDGDTRDQAYLGVPYETPATDAAVTATAGDILEDSTGAPILAQYSSSDGGWTVSGDVDYLPAQRDPYDGMVRNGEHSWTRSVSAAAITAAYPSVGRLERVIVTGRDGHGVWGGRVTSLELVGAKGTVDVAGTDFQWALGLWSPWWRPTPTPGSS